MRYLSQRYSMEDRKVVGALTDIGTEELGYLKIVHFLRFGECLRRIQDQRNPKNFYAYNPQIDRKSCW